MADLGKAIGTLSKGMPSERKQGWSDSDWTLWLVGVTIACFIILVAVAYVAKEMWLSYLETACQIYIKTY